METMRDYARKVYKQSAERFYTFAAGLPNGPREMTDEMMEELKLINAATERARRYCPYADLAKIDNRLRADL